MYTSSQSFTLRQERPLLAEDCGRREYALAMSHNSVKGPPLPPRRSLLSSPCFSVVGGEQKRKAPPSKGLPYVLMAPVCAQGSYGSWLLLPQHLTDAGCRWRGERGCRNGNVIRRSRATR